MSKRYHITDEADLREASALLGQKQTDHRLAIAEAQNPTDEDNFQVQAIMAH
jgi:hypothetical protein